MNIQVGLAHNMETPKQKMISERKKVYQDTFVNAVLTHEGLEPYQTPFRITDPSMAKWKSMFDDTIVLKLNPNYPKPKNRQNFLYVKNEGDVNNGVNEQFRRYAKNPKKYGLTDEPTIREAVMLFDQTGANGKLAFLEKHGIDTNTKLKEIY